MSLYYKNIRLGNVYATAPVISQSPLFQSIKTLLVTNGYTITKDEDVLPQIETILDMFELTNEQEISVINDLSQVMLEYTIIKPTTSILNYASLLETYLQDNIDLITLTITNSELVELADGTYNLVLEE